MRRTFSLAITPLVAAMGACSSHSGAQNGPSDGGAQIFTDDGSVQDEAGGGGDGNTSTPYQAILSGAQVVPAVLTGDMATANFALQEDGQTLNYDITQSVAGATAVNLHLAAPGETGAVTHQLSPVSGHMTGSVTLSSDEQSAISIDQLYVDIQTQSEGGGHIRGQVTPPGATIYVAMPTGAQEAPPVTTTYTASASFVLSADQGTVIYHVSTTAVPTNVLLERAIGSLNGQVAYPLAPIGQTMDGSVQLAASDPDDLSASHFYVNIQTAANQAGELRGQILPPGATLFTGVLAGLNEVPAVASQATGGVQFVLSADQTQVAYEAVVSGVIPTGAEVDQGAAGQNGPTLYQLTLDPEGALGTTAVAPSDVQMLFGGSLYVNIRTASYASGELRAQLGQQ